VRIGVRLDQLRQDCLAVEDFIGDTMLTSIVAKRYVERLLENEVVTT
jgi:hypothetical protein